jgi:all-trans-retinol dehydrogenase (NAD+)
MVERRRGHLVTIASASGLIGVAKLADYSASKWAAIGFDESLRVELKRLAPEVRTTVVCPYYVNTGMFTGVKSRFSWMMPILEEAHVVRRIVEAIERDRRRVVMPWPVFLLPLMRLLPIPLFDALANFLGVNVSMDEFVGRQREAVPAQPAAAGRGN